MALGRPGEQGLVSHSRDPGKHGFHRYSVTPQFGELVSRIESGIREERARYSERIRRMKEGLGR